MSARGKQALSRALFTSGRQDWGTPDDIFADLHAEFGFTVDVCAHKDNAKLPRYWSPSENALWQSWKGERCWMNPPYSEIGRWMSRAFEAWEAGAFVVALVPSRTDTRWWHDYAMKATEIRFVKGRLRFGGSANGAPFPSAVLIFGQMPA